MPDLSDAGTRDAILSRIQRLDASSQPRWGTMSAGQMVVHCALQLKLALGELDAAAMEPARVEASRPSPAPVRRLTGVTVRSMSALCVLVLAAAACGGERQDRSAAVDTTALATAQPDPVINDTLTIYEATSLPGQPYWAVEILNEGIRYHWAGNRAGVVFGAGRFEGGDSLSVWTAKRTVADGPQSLQLELLRVPCGSGANAMPYRVALVVDGEARQGCARRGTLAAQQGAQ